MIIITVVVFTATTSAVTPLTSGSSPFTTVTNTARQCHFIIITAVQASICRTTIFTLPTA